MPRPDRWCLRFAAIARRVAIATAVVLTVLPLYSFATLPLDLGVYRVANGNVYLDYHRNGIVAHTVHYAQPPEAVLVADMNGDGLADLVAYRAGVWTADYDLDGVPDATWYFGGAPGDVPLLGDIDGDGSVDLVVYHAGDWYVSTRRDGVADQVLWLGGAANDVPLLADVHCSGFVVPVLFRDGTWLAYGGAGRSAIVLAMWGAPGDRPFVVDWDGDCNDDLGVFRDGAWYVLRHVLEQPLASVAGFGGANDAPLAGRLDRALLDPKYRSARTHYGLYRPGDNTFLLRLATEDFPDLVLDTGVAGTPLAADFDGDGATDLAVYSNGLWRIDVDLDGRFDLNYAFGGAPGDVPLAADVDGDGRVDLVIYRDGTWHVSSARNGTVSLVHYFGGMPGDQPVLADMNGGGRVDFGVYRAGVWYFDTDRDGRADLVYRFGGAPEDRAMIADWNDDGRPDLVVYRAGQWFVSTVPASGAVTMQAGFGALTDAPIAGTFVLKTSVEPVLFAPRARPLYSGNGELLSLVVTDLNGDGWPDTLGGRNDGSGTLVDAPIEDAGLGSIFSPNRKNRDCRIADFNGDGRLDVVCNTYSAPGDQASFARLFFGTANGTFAEDAAFAAMNLRGWGETIVAADFDNDGAVDLFLPYYSHTAPGEHSYLLRNDGTGQFVDIADSAGVALRNVPLDNRVEAAQAVDYDGDGWIDLYVGGRLFHNNGDRTFTDVTAAVGLPGTFDEGAKFLDWNNDGRLDLIIHHPTTGPKLWEFDGARFVWRDVLPHYAMLYAYGLNIGDLNGDGREDLVVSGGESSPPFVLLNAGVRFERNPVSLLDALPFGLSSMADLDQDGRLDLFVTDGYGMRVAARNISPSVIRQPLTIEIVDAAGRRNQFGRVASITPIFAPTVTMTRVVDGGSGLMSQTPYPITVPTPYKGLHRVTIRFASSTVTFQMSPGQRMRVYADGRTELF